MVKNLPVDAGYKKYAGSTLVLGRSPRGGNGNPLQYSCLEDSMDRGAWACKESDTTEQKAAAQFMNHESPFKQKCRIYPRLLSLLNPSNLIH